MITDLQRAHQSHDVRVCGLLTANNREVKRRRALRATLEAIACGDLGAMSCPDLQERARLTCEADDRAAKN